MENFSVKEYYYEQKAIGLSDARIAENLGTTEETLHDILGFAKIETVKAVDNKTEEKKFVENHDDKKDKKDPHVEAKKAEVQEDLSWME